MKRRLALLALPLILLAACGGKEDLIAPSPLPDIAPSVRIGKLWSVDTGEGSPHAGARLVPAVAGNTVYVVDGAGRVVARDRATGKAAWRRDTGLSFSAGPVAAYGQLFAGTNEGELVALSADDGTTLWPAQLPGEVLAPPAVEGDAVVVKTSDGRVTLLERTTGAVRWTHDGGSPPLSLRASSRPVLVSDAVIAGLPSGVLVALERASGQTVWERRIGEPTGKSELERVVDIAGDFALAGDRLFAATFQGRIVAMDLRSGQFLWQQPLSTWLPLVADDGNVYAVDGDGRVIAYRGTDGAVLWRLESLLGRTPGAPALAGPYLLLGDFEGWLHVIRTADGVLAGRVRVDRAGITAAPVVDGDTWFVLGAGGRLAALKVE